MASDGEIQGGPARVSLPEGKPWAKVERREGSEWVGLAWLPSWSEMNGEVPLWPGSVELRFLPKGPQSPEKTFSRKGTWLHCHLLTCLLFKYVLTTTFYNSHRAFSYIFSRFLPATS